MARGEDWLTLAVVLGFAVVHIAGWRLVFLDVRPRSTWLSGAGGVSVAYVFVHVLPDLARHQRSFGPIGGAPGLPALERHVYLIALLGLVIFFGLERLARTSRRANTASGDPPHPSPAAFWLHLGAFALYNVLIGYLVVHRQEQNPRGLAIFAFALALHFVVNDQGLRELHGALYRERGRWLLATAPVVGWTIGMVTVVGPLAIGALFALLAGAVVLNVLKEELPEDRESRFTAFAAGAFGYAMLLLAVD